MKLIISTAILILVSGNVHSLPENVGPAKVTSIESRVTGLHDIYLSLAIPTQACPLEDRAVVDETTSGGKTMTSLLLTSLVSGKDVIVRVNGCLSDRPNIVKVHIIQ